MGVPYALCEKIHYIIICLLGRANAEKEFVKVLKLSNAYYDNHNHNRNNHNHHNGNNHDFSVLRLRLLENRRQFAFVNQKSTRKQKITRAIP